MHSSEGVSMHSQYALTLHSDTMIGKNKLIKITTGAEPEPGTK